MLPASGQMNLHFQSTLVNSIFNGTWVANTGTIEIDGVKLLKQLGRPSIQDFSFSFNVVNQQTGQASPNVTVKHTIFNVPGQGGEATRTFQEDMPPDTSSILSWSTAESIMPSTSNDAMPLYIPTAVSVRVCVNRQAHSFSLFFLCS